MNWKFVMKTDNVLHFEEAVKLARKVGYEFVLWDDEIWFVNNHNHYKTSLTVNDLY